MGLYIQLCDNNNQEIISLNWLRNPFGLCNWAEDNVGVDNALWRVCNNWSYDKAYLCNRPLFKSAVDSYWANIQSKPAFYFYFTDKQYRQFVEPYLMFFPLFIHFEQTDGRIAIPLSQFDRELPPKIHVRRSNSKSLKQQYLDWFAELVRFAELLQNEDYSFYCSN